MSFNSYTLILKNARSRFSQCVFKLSLYCSHRYVNALPKRLLSGQWMSSPVNCRNSGTMWKSLSLRSTALKQSRMTLLLSAMKKTMFSQSSAWFTCEEIKHWNGKKYWQMYVYFRLKNVCNPKIETASMPKLQ